MKDMNVYRFRLSMFIINIGVSLLPDDWRNKTYINNCIHCKKIKVEDI